MPVQFQYDVIIVGAGPAGLSAALVLGRCLRKVLLLDNDRPRNAFTHGVHGFFTRDGILPMRLRELGRLEAEKYGVKYKQATVTQAKQITGGFEIITEAKERARSRKLLIATGVMDKVPNLEGIEAIYGKSVHHCPYCDAWEWKGHPIAIYGCGKGAHALTKKLYNWSTDLIICCDGKPSRFTASQLRDFELLDIRVIKTKIARLEAKKQFLKRIHFTDGSSIARDALFFTTGQQPACRLAHDLGCEFTEKGTVKTNRVEGTNIPGLYVAGDASKDMQFVIVAAAEGAKAAVAINERLQEENLKARFRIK